jgi:hypothetical protein
VEFEVRLRAMQARTMPAISAYKLTQLLVRHVCALLLHNAAQPAS